MAIINFFEEMLIEGKVYKSKKLETLRSEI